MVTVVLLLLLLCCCCCYLVVVDYDDDDGGGVVVVVDDDGGGGGGGGCGGGENRFNTLTVSSLFLVIWLLHDFDRWCGRYCPYVDNFLNRTTLWQKMAW